MFKPYTPQDLRAPRFRPPVAHLTQGNFTRRFNKQFPDHKDLKSGELNNIIRTTHEKMWNHIINNRDGVELPEGLGYIFIGSCPPLTVKKNRDIVKSSKYGVELTHTNLGSDSFVAKIFYTNFSNSYKFKMRELWTFKGCRDFTRATSKSYRENWKIFTQVDSFSHIKDIFEKARRIELGKRYNIVPEGYNEFNLD